MLQPESPPHPRLLLGLLPPGSRRPFAAPGGTCRVRWLAGRCVLGLFLTQAVIALGATPALSAELAWGTGRVLSGAVGLSFAAAAIALARGAGGNWQDRSKALVERLRAAGWPRRAVVWLAIGLCLRTGWASLFPAPATSDAGNYLQLAEGLAHGEPFLIGGKWSYWPPGYPLFLTPLFWLGMDRAQIWLVNLGLFVATALALRWLAGLIVAPAEAGRSCWGLAALLAFWPNHILQTPIASKELLLVFLLPLAIALYLRSEAASGAVPQRAWLLGSGTAAGFAALVQPSFLLFSGLFAGYELLVGTGWRKTAGKLSWVAAGVVVVLTPWLARNFARHPGHLVLTTNGGSVFYRANNPLASGGYTPRGERNLEAYGELASSRQGYAWGSEWITTHPVEFVRLALRKQVLYLGDDSTGAYETLKRGLGIRGTFYTAAKFVSNAFWWALWLALLAGWARRAGPPPIEAPYLLLMLATLYPLAVHSIFESNGKYHFPTAGLLLVLAVLAGVGRGTAVRGSTCPANPG